MLKRNRADANARKQANAISSLRFGIQCASRTPYDAVKLDSGAISAKPISDTNPTDSGGNCGI